MTETFDGTITGSAGSKLTVHLQVDPPVVVTPPPPPPAAAPTITIGTTTLPVHAVNPVNALWPGGRGPEELEVYVPPLLTTGANHFGWEIPFSADGTLGVGSGAGNMTVPANGGVLSAHGGMGDRLKAAAATATHVTLTGVVGLPTPPVVVPPVVTPPPPPVVTPAAGRLAMLWHQGWSAKPLGSIPESMLAALNVVVLGICQSARAGTGQLADPPGVTAAEVKVLTARRIDVFAGIGGGGDGGVSIVTATEVGEALASILSMRTRLGITGVVMDLEGDPGSGWTVQSMIDLGHAVTAAGLKFGICSGTYGGRLEAWGAVAAALGSSLHSWQRMFYDYPEAATSAQTGIVTGDVPALLHYLALPPQEVVLFMPAGGSDVNTSPVNVIRDAYTAALKLNGRLGFSVFDDALEGGVDHWAAVETLAGIAAA